MGEKNITINELAKMVKTGFDEIGKQFKKTNNRFERIESRLTTVEEKLDNIDFRIC